MTATDPRSQATREALLNAGARIFARHGQAAVKLREIAAEAGTPISAIHYHFGGKDELYAAVLAHLAGEALARFPLPATVPESNEPLPPVEIRLQLAIKQLLSRFFANDGNTLIGQLLAQELTNPSPALDTLIEAVSRPQFQRMSALVAELLSSERGADPSPDLIRRCTVSLLGQCLIYLLAQPALSRLFPGLYSPFDLDGLAAHISLFSIAGLRAAARAEPPASSSSEDQ